MSTIDPNAEIQAHITELARRHVTAAAVLRLIITRLEEREHEGLTARCLDVAEELAALEGVLFMLDAADFAPLRDVVRELVAGKPVEARQ